ncbi:MAG: hypothetical protein H8E40_03980 [Chloroflexi bacterium]|nr:hypothetical protein [Chloroflexota bacterium]
MKYTCLRTCYASDRLYHKDGVYELPDEMRKSEKNFQLVGTPVQVEVVKVEAEAIEAEVVEQSLPLAGEFVEVAPLYLSDKPKRKKKKAVKKNG